MDFDTTVADQAAAYLRSVTPARSATATDLDDPERGECLGRHRPIDLHQQRRLAERPDHGGPIATPAASSLERTVAAISTAPGVSP